MKDVGATNKTYTEDYRNAISDETGAIRMPIQELSCNHLHFQIDIEGIAKISRISKIPFILYAGSGCIANFDKFSMPAKKQLGDISKKVLIL